MRCSSTVDVKVGVLALQGDVSEHIDAFRLALKRRNAGSRASVVEVRNPTDLVGCKALAIPGGESTTISRLIDKNHLYEPIRNFPGGIFATCAGMVLVATRVDDPRIHPLGIIGMSVDRNAFGRQKESFEADIIIGGVDSKPFHAIFIRAPVATTVEEDVHVLARVNRGIVAVEKKKHMALAFHPELGGDTRLHERFLDTCGC